MVNIPLNRMATKRLLDQTTRKQGADIASLYLRALGITDLSLQKVPEIVSLDFRGEWEAFLKTSTIQDPDPARRALRAALSFLEYCSAIKLDVGDPHFTFRDPITGKSRVEPKRIRVALMRYDQSRLLRSLQHYVVDKFRLKEYFKVYRTKVSATKVGRNDKIVATYVLKSSNDRRPLDAILPLLSGRLYNGDIPPQLAKMERNGKDVRPYFDTLLTGAGTAGWYMISSNQAYSLMMLRARNGLLVVKVVIHVPTVSVQHGDIPAAVQAKAWAKLKLF